MKEPSQSGLASPPLPARLVAIDAYRGLVMFLMLAEVLHFRKVAKAFPGNELWSLLADHQTHVEWIGCSLHDLIQPSFSFLVGVSLPFSIASRLDRGQSKLRMTLHAFARAIMLVALGVFLRSTGETQTRWTFEDTLSQIGLGYGFLFLLGFRSMRTQFLALGAILVGYWGAFALYSPGADFDYTKVDVPASWPHLMTGFQAHWNKNGNLAWAFDRWFLNLFPRKSPWVDNAGGYATLSFIPTLGTMILGLIAGEVLRKPWSAGQKIGWFVVAGLIGLGAGYGLGYLGVCPVVKRIWTPSWVLFSGGWCFLLLAAWYALTDAVGLRLWAFPLVVIGMNSIAVYCMSGLWKPFIEKNLQTHFGSEIFNILGEGYRTLLLGGSTLLVLWLILFWMYRRRIFVRI